MNKPGLQDQTVAAALGRSEPLTGLLQRMRESRARLEALAPLFPPGLADGVRAGPLDDEAWVLLVPHAAAAAKLRQMLPALDATLRGQGWPGPPIKIKVLPRA
jgi:Dna[CI] antecedent, DciA